MKNLPTNLQEIYLKLTKYCAYQERCTADIYQYLSKYKLTEEDEQTLIECLKKDKFLDDTRFAIQFAVGKFHTKKWGKIKIAYTLRQKQIPDPLIEEALQHISDEEYYQTLQKLIEKSGYDTNDYTQKGKLLRFLYNKGYGCNEIKQVLEDIEDEY
ncbi:MAG: RecX family transcriptional regulator [Bacteroidia bacterium]|nr:RecX family transcriptional regulator [Bacteroidia bacterium]MDW8346650.1 regulatory protein RecX [Bacteroidia bacterium]